jgi:uncharacterized protein YhaN
MRITGLHLHAYGHFTGCSLDFGPDGAPAPDMPPGLHLVYGHNEAGKSTTLRALSSVLFGYPHLTVDSFKHGVKDIAIGIDLLAADGRPLSFVRRRRGKLALATADGAALDDATVGNFLGGVSRDVFEKVFALDHRRLREHAQALLADGGSLGFSLAEAGSGIAGLKAVLDRLEKERGELFLPGGSKPALNKAIAEYVKLRKDARQLVVSPTEYHGHEKRIGETEDELQRLRAQRKEAESAIVRLQRIQRNLPLRAEHRALTERIAALDEVPLLPPEFAQQRVKASVDLEAARTELDVASAAIEDLERRLAAVAIDADILARGEDIEDLAQRRPVIEKYDAESPGREAEREELLARVADLMAMAELDGGPAGLAVRLPSALKRKAIQALGEQGKKLRAQRTTLEENAEAAARLLDKARDYAAQLPKPRSVAKLSRALEAANDLGPVTADIARRTRALERKTKALNETIASLGLAAGGREGPGADCGTLLRELTVPSERTEARYAEQLGDVNQKIKRTRDEVERLDTALADTDKLIIKLKTAGDIATEDDLKAARDAREQGWLLVRGFFVDRHGGLEDAGRRFAPDGRIAETYEARVHDADRVVDTLRARVKESTELAFLKRQALDHGAKRAEAAKALQLHSEQRNALLSEWRALWPAGVVTVQSPGEMIDWLAQRRSALAVADEVEEERDAIMERLKQAHDAQRALADAMTAFSGESQDDDLDILRDRARSLLEEAANAKSRYDNAETAVRTRSEQKAQADEAASKMESCIGQWTVDWQKALAEAGLPCGLTIETAAANLDAFKDLDGVKSKVERLNRDIDAAQAARDAFDDAVAGVASALLDAPAGSAVAVCLWLEKRLRKARDARTTHEGLAEQIAGRMAERDRAGDKLRRSSEAIEVLRLQAGAARPDEIPEIEGRSAAKREADGERRRIETRVREDGGGRSFIDLFAECDDVAGDGIAADLISLKAERDEIEAGIDALTLERAKLQAAFDSLLGQNQAADLTQAAAAVGADIEDAVADYVDLTVQETLLRAAIDVYRDRNQGPILTRARNLFVQLTDGAYAGLRADVERGETILIVEDPARGSLELDALSDGTVDAVYLALRLAVVQEHNASHEPLPFIADDLLLNLDNRRAEAALRTLAELAKTTQVLLFTHHAHMAELARRAVSPDILVEHSLSPPIGRADRLCAAAE